MMVTVCVLGGTSRPGAVGLDSVTLNVLVAVTLPSLMMGTVKELVPMPLVKTSVPLVAM